MIASRWRYIRMRKNGKKIKSKRQGESPQFAGEVEDLWSLECFGLQQLTKVHVWLFLMSLNVHGTFCWSILDVHAFCEKSAIPPICSRRVKNVLQRKGSSWLNNQRSHSGRVFLKQEGPFLWNILGDERKNWPLFIEIRRKQTPGH
jgi:hypothetical protein